MKLILVGITTLIAFNLYAQRKHPAKGKPDPWSLHDTLPKPGSVLTCNRIVFEPASVFMTPGSELFLDSLASWMKANRLANIKVRYVQYDWPAQAPSGYVAKRAQVIIDYLVGSGLEEDRFTKHTITYRKDQDLDEFARRTTERSYKIQFAITKPPIPGG